MMKPGLAPAVAWLLAAACATVPPPVAAPRPAAPSTVAVAERPAPPAPDTMVSYRVPPFRPQPIITWGPLPPGEPRAAPERTFDLRHQVVRVRFDRDRGAVLGSTTLRIAGLPGGPPQSVIRLDAADMTIVGVKGAASGALRHEHDGRSLVVHLPEPLVAATPTTITIEYETQRPARGVRFVPRRRVVWTQGQPADTRYWVPTFDHPSDRTTWEILVRTPASEMALSNGRLVASRRVGREIEWHWSLESPAPTYLMSIVTGDYAVLQDSWRSTPLGYWTYPDSVAAAWRGFGKTPRMMEWLGTRTGVFFPWRKYDQVVVPDFIYAGMENVTATTMSDDAILHPEWAEPHAGPAAESLVLHELAHHWFGNLVTVRDWPHVWLSEGFARMFEAAWREAEHGVDEAEYARFVVREAALAADRRARRPLVYGRWARDPIELFLTGHAHARGAAVLEMLRARLGDAVFQKGVERYLTAHRFGVAESSDLRAALEGVTSAASLPASAVTQASGPGLEGDGRTAGAAIVTPAVDLSRFFDQWVYGGGYPVLRVSFAFDTATRTLALEAAQVQPRDSLTGFFDGAVAVEVLTDSGPVRASLELRDSLSRIGIPLPAPPRAIIWDRDARLLHVADFPRPTVMLVRQLEHATTVPARLEAVSLLADRWREPAAVAALGRAARADAFWAVRMRAISALGGAVPDVPADLGLLAGPVVDAVIQAQADRVAGTVLDSSHDRDARVREAAASALGALPRREAAVQRLATLVNSDPSRFVRGAAVRALAAVDRSRALPTIRDMLRRDSWRDIERHVALAAIAEVGGDEGWRLARGSLGAVVPATRSAAVWTLVTLATSEGRIAATVDALRARRGIEEDGAVRDAIDAALARLRPTGSAGR